MKNVIANLIIILLISIFILINSQYRTPINLYGFKIDSISIVLIMIVSFLTGIAFTMVYLGIMKLKKKKKENAEKFAKADTIDKMDNLNDTGKNSIAKTHDKDQNEK